MVYVWAIMMHMLMKEEKEFNEALWAEGMLGFGAMTKKKSLGASIRKDIQNRMFFCNVHSIF